VFVDPTENAMTQQNQPCSTTPLALPETRRRLTALVWLQALGRPTHPQALPPRLQQDVGVAQLTHAPRTVHRQV
ncbi:MAG: hypothetical protein MO852_15585, partial [Candidatus Devosia euplotis]|nr:hypothetical protein [Candidatus Devosia euplotis]